MSWFGVSGVYPALLLSTVKPISIQFGIGAVKSATDVLAVLRTLHIPIHTHTHITIPVRSCIPRDRNNGDALQGIRSLFAARIPIFILLVIVFKGERKSINGVLGNLVFRLLLPDSKGLAWGKRPGIAIVTEVAGTGCEFPYVERLSATYAVGVRSGERRYG